MSNQRVIGVPSGLVYGASKSGKTLTLGRAMPCALFLTEDATGAGVQSILAAAGIMPKWRATPTLQNLTAALSALRDAFAKAKTEGRVFQFDGVAIDDLTLMADASLERWKRRKEQAVNKFWAWDQLRAALYQIRVLLREIGLPYGITAHARHPTYDDKAGRRRRGGPSLPSKEQTDTLPVICSTVVRTQVHDGSWPYAWNGALSCDPCSVDWVEGDRNGVAPPIGPMNLGELFRLGGHVVRRPKGLEWMEEVTERVATQVAADPESVEDVKARAVTVLVAKGLPPIHVRWAIIDGLDRYYLRVACDPLAALNSASGVLTM